MRVAVSDIVGLADVPAHRTSAARWFERNGIAIHGERKRGARQQVCLSDLPGPLVRAYQERVFAERGLSSGAYDCDAHRVFEGLSKGVRERAERRAAIARYIAARGGDGLSIEIIEAVQAEFGKGGTSEPSIRRIMTDIEGIDPINWTPALAPKHKGRTAKAETSEAAWQWFLSLLKEAAPHWPIKSAWSRVKREAKAKSWAWPSYPTINRRWHSLTKREQLIIRYGREEADKRLYQPTRRNPKTIKPLEWVSLDGRTLDLWADFGDGKPRRPVMLVLVDCASGKVLDFLLSQSENAERTRDLIINVCQAHGAFDKLYPDNGSAFAGHVIAGRTKHKFRNGQNRDLEREQPGVCAQLGIEISFALPGNGQAKIAERKFCDFSRQIDDGPEFCNAHAGHEPGQRPSAKVVPVPIETVEAVYRREIAIYNAEAGRRSGACGGKLSYDEAFNAGLIERVPRVLTDRQIMLARLKYKAVTVDARGQFKVSGWTYGSFDTQDALLRYEGQKIFVGYVSDDMSSPVVAYDTEDERLICEGIPVVEVGPYQSEAGAKLAAKGRATVKKRNREAEEAMDLIPRADVAARLAIRSANAAPELAGSKASAPVVKGTFGAPIKPGNAADTKASEPKEHALSVEKSDEMSRQILANARKANLRSGHS